MKKCIGNVVTDSNPRLDLGLVKRNTMNDIDKNVPTLVIGLDNAKKYVEDFHILKKKATNQDELWWTYKKTERRDDYKDDMDEFYKHCLNKITDEIDYELIDVLKIDKSKIRKVVKYLKSDDFKYVYNDRNQFVFIYSPRYKRIWGISLSTCNYCGVSNDRVLKILKDNSNNHFISDFSKIPSKIKHILDEKLHKFIIIFDYFNI